MPDSRTIQPVPKKKRILKRKKPADATNAVVIAAVVEPKGNGVKAGSKPVLSSSTTKSMAKLHPAMISRPPASSSVPTYSGPKVSATISSNAGTMKSMTQEETHKVIQKNLVENSSHQARLLYPYPVCTEMSAVLIDQYFSQEQFWPFQYRYREPLMEQFDRLSAMMGWNESKTLWMKEHNEFMGVLVSQFNLYYGMDAECLETWQELCRAIRIHPIPASLEDARDVVCRSYVNIIDLIESKRTPKIAAPTFASHAALKSYTEYTRKFFPSNHQDAAGVLRYLAHALPLPTSSTTSHVAVQYSRRSTVPLDPDSFIDNFFSRYPGFPYDPSKPIMGQYFKLCTFLDLRRGSLANKKAWEGILTALVLQFNKYFGVDRDSLDSWVGLCAVIAIVPIPDTMVECRTTVAHLQVNLVDLVEGRRMSASVRIFPNVEALSEYTKQTGKYFPQNHELAGGVLQYLLRQIDFPELERGRDRVAESLRDMKI